MEWNFRNDLPIYTQLIEHIIGAIVSGEMPPGSKLPSVRDLAVDAKVNPNTAQRALTDLEREGIVYSQRTAGRFVTEDETLIKAKKLQLAEEKVAGILCAMTKLGISKSELIDLLQNMKGDQK